MRFSTLIAAVTLAVGFVSGCGQPPAPLEQPKAPVEDVKPAPVSAEAPVPAEPPLAATGQAQLSDAEAAEGWKLLFDGATTAGWRGYRGQTFPTKGWDIQDGALHCMPRGQGGDLITQDQFTNFELRFEWKAAPGANSGVMYRVAETDEYSFMTGPEYQVLDDEKHPDGENALTSAASLYALYSPENKTLKPVGEFNEGRIILNGAHVEHWLNGQKVVEAELGSEDWNTRIANSKFKDWERFSKMPSGHIALQDHGDEVWYRNIRIKQLP
ncbi:MAG: hypothetical protein GHCLOJNM_02538 [bacterium]|nr:hypothetical protein [bacterium]